MAINNAAVIVEPQAFIALDAAKCFNYNIFNNPRILKLVNYARQFDMIDGRRLCDCPNTLFYEMQDERQMMMSEFCRLEGPLPFWRNTFFTALAALYQLGIREVYLIGCTFDIKNGAYAHGAEPPEYLKRENQVLYSDTVEKLRDLIPMVADEGMKVMTCHPNTSLEGICQYVPFEDAISYVVTESTKIGIGPMSHAKD